MGKISEHAVGAAHAAAEEPRLKCRRCGWVGGEGDLRPVSYREDFGDVSTVACPSCGRMYYEGDDFENVFEEVPR